ncbi:uncharacterized protein [Salminus brasiliensis]|uniref:uncharacterized protein n=1 Tax=Salminus brasiliensis TaxID=930266 RepID=UPI003B8340AD
MSSFTLDKCTPWSELSEVYSQNQHQRHLSLAQSQQFLREEELRARQYSALFRLREKALQEKTQAELAWLEHCKKQVTSEDEALAEIKRKQEDVVNRLRQEQAELHHWRNVYKSGRQQRRLLLCHQKDILDIERSTTHFREVLQKQVTAETATRPGDMAPALVTTLHQLPSLDHPLTSCPAASACLNEGHHAKGLKRCHCTGGEGLGQDSRIGAAVIHSVQVACRDGLMAYRTMPCFCFLSTGRKEFYHRVWDYTSSRKQR